MHELISAGMLGGKVWSIATPTMDSTGSSTEREEKWTRGSLEEKPEDGKKRKLIRCGAKISQNQVEGIFLDVLQDGSLIKTAAYHNMLVVINLNLILIH